MEGLENVLLVIALFVLRLGVPLIITLAIGYALSRLDARWQAEADAQRAEEAQAAAAEKPHRQEIGRSPARPIMPIGQPLMARDFAGLPCWSLKGCSESVKATCAACYQPNRPCWQARASAEGRLPAECKHCDIYLPQMPLMGQQDLIH